MLTLEEKNELLERAWRLSHQNRWHEVLRIQQSTVVPSKDPELNYLFSHALFRLGRVEEAFVLSTLSIAPFAVVGTIYRKNLNLLGSIEVERGNLGTARSYFQRLMEDAGAASDHFNRAVAVMNLGVIDCICCLWEEALIAFQHALASFQRSGHRYNIAACHQNAGITCREIGRYSEADSHLEKAHAIISSDFPRENVMYYVEAERALLLATMGDLTHAESVLHRCLAGDQTQYSSRARGELLRALGVILGKQGKTDAARSALTEGLYYSTDVKGSLLEAEICEELALLASKADRKNEFDDYCARVEEIYKLMGAYKRIERFESRTSAL